MFRKITILLVFSFSFICRQPVALSANSVCAHLTPECVEIGAFFNGCKIFVSGEVPQDAQVAVRLSGMRKDVALKNKGKVLGLLWMNLGNLTIHNAPSIYLVCLSKDLEKFAETQPEKWEKLSISFDSLKKQINIGSAGKDSEAIFKEFLKLRESEGLYAIQTGSVKYGTSQGGGKSFQAALEIPPRLTPGKYLVEVFAVKEGSVAARTARELKVSQVGLPSFLTTLAYKRGGIYGVLATIVAIVAGLLIGVIFKGAKGGH